MAMNNGLKRVLTAIGFVAVMVACLLYNQYSYMIIFGLIMIGCVYELHEIAGQSKKLSFLVIAIGFLIYFIAYRYPATIALVLGLISIIFNFLFLTSLYSDKIKIPKKLIGVTYLVLPISALNYVAFYTNKYSAAYILLPIFTIWLSDTFAYFTGSLLGKHKLFPSVSPKKTWEGLLGGLVAVIAFGYIAPVFMPISMTKFHSIIFVTITAIAGIYGDLYESKLKRQHEVKDSGTILPGHGGILDRFDAFIFCIPFVVCYLFILKP